MRITTSPGRPTPPTPRAAASRYSRQAQIAHWNLAQLANALYPLIGDAALLEQALRDYSLHFEQGWQTMMAGKLGLVAFEPATDRPLVDDLLRLLPGNRDPMTSFFRLVSTPLQAIDDADRLTTLADVFYRPEQLTGTWRKRWIEWLARYAARLSRDNQPEAVRRARMNAVNPKYVLRNYLAQLAIDKVMKASIPWCEELFRRPASPV